MEIVKCKMFHEETVSSCFFQFSEVFSIIGQD